MTGHRVRLDVALTEAGMAESRAQAQALIIAGKVRVAGETVRRPFVQRNRAQAAIEIDRRRIPIEYRPF